jgi:hypothetical protein
MMLSCDGCKGKKKIVGLGNILQDCPTCRGIGWIELPENALKVTLADVMTTVKRKKKKVINEPVLNC